MSKLKTVPLSELAKEVKVPQRQARIRLRAAFASLSPRSLPEPLKQNRWVFRANQAAKVKQIIAN